MFVIIIFPLLDNDSSIISRLGASLVNSSTYFKVSLAGQFSPVAAGDYGSGTNHVLPTGGGAKISVARYFGIAVSSAKIKTSDGPAGNSIST